MTWLTSREPRKTFDEMAECCLMWSHMSKRWELSTHGHELLLSAFFKPRRFYELLPIYEFMVLGYVRPNGATATPLGIELYEHVLSLRSLRNMETP